MLKDNTLYLKAPHLIKEWDYDKNTVDPKNICPNYNKKVWWKCNLGHSWEATPNKRYSKGTNCPYCAGKKVWKGFNDLATKYPSIAAEWDYSCNDCLPSEVTSGSQKKIHWVCGAGHKWITKINCRTQNKPTGCPYCCGKYVIPGKTDCASLYPELIAEWDDVRNNKPLSSVSHGDERKYWWRCKYGHSYQTSPNHRTSGKEGCPYCAGKRVWKGFNDLASQYPVIAKEFDKTKNNQQPDEIIAHSNKKVWWVCDCGHKWKASPNLRISNSTGCPVCNQSHGEKIIRQYLESHHLRYEEQYVFADRFIYHGHYLKDDFALLNTNNEVVATIEYNGIQHYQAVDFYGGQKKYEQTQKLDQYKSDYLRDHGILQIIIPYTSIDKINDILDKQIASIADKISK